MADRTSRTIVVTGGDVGIGRAIVQGLIDDGDRVINVSLALPDFAHDRLINIVGDLTDPGDLKRIAAEVATTGATGFVHNAGVIRPGLLPEVTDLDLDYVVNLHLRAAIHIGQALLPAMEAAGSGRIVFIASRGAQGLQTRSVYSATKAGMIGMARTWALELAGKGITVNVVSPGPIESDMFHEIVPEGSERKQKLAASIPVGRIGRPDDVAFAVRYFLDPRADFVTGQNLLVCGGSSIGSIAI